MENGPSTAFVVETPVVALRVIRFAPTPLLSPSHDDLEFQSKWDSALSDISEGETLAVNLADVQHLSSTFLGYLIKADKAVRKQNGRMVIAGANTDALEAFQITKLKRLFDFAENVDDVIKQSGAT
jgi:anti-anti-sigma factor